MANEVRKHLTDLNEICKIQKGFLIYQKCSTPIFFFEKTIANFNKLLQKFVIIFFRTTSLFPAAIQEPFPSPKNFIVL